MDIQMEPPAYSREERKLVTFAEVATKIGPYVTLHEALLAFGAFFSSQENVRLCR
jgi:alkylhydroperoxidase family enzyme